MKSCIRVGLLLLVTACACEQPKAFLVLCVHFVATFLQPLEFLQSLPSNVVQVGCKIQLMQPTCDPLFLHWNQYVSLLVAFWGVLLLVCWKISPYILSPTLVAVRRWRIKRQGRNERSCDNHPGQS